MIDDLLNLKVIVNHSKPLLGHKSILSGNHMMVGVLLLHIVGSIRSFPIKVVRYLICETCSCEWVINHFAVADLASWFSQTTAVT